MQTKQKIWILAGVSLFFLLPVFSWLSGCGSYQKAEKNQQIEITAAPTAIPAEDSITIINYVLFLSRLKLDPGNPVLQVHVENHSDSILKDFSIDLVNLYRTDSRELLSSYRLFPRGFVSPFDLAVHALKNLDFDLAPLSKPKADLGSVASVFGQYRVKYNGQERLISTRPVSIKRQ